jgi:hypothetical protein
MGVRTVLGIVAAGSKNSATDWLSSDITITRASKLCISIGTATAFTLEITKDSTNYLNGETFAAGDAKDLTLYVKAGDTLNLRQSSGGAVTLRYCDIFEVD